MNATTAAQEALLVTYTVHGVGHRSVFVPVTAETTAAHVTTRIANLVAEEFRGTRAWSLVEAQPYRPA